MEKNSSFIVFFSFFLPFFYFYGKICSFLLLQKTKRLCFPPLKLGQRWSRKVCLFNEFEKITFRRISEMLRIRLKRIGKKHSPFYRIVVCDREQPRNGVMLDEIGTYDPLNPEDSEIVKLNDVDGFWALIKKGAVPSQTVISILKKVGIQYNQYIAEEKAKRVKAKKEKRKKSLSKLSPELTKKRNAQRRTRRAKKVESLKKYKEARYAKWQAKKKPEEAPAEDGDAKA
jgi:small subunit ribosomal protein S16